MYIVYYIPDFLAIKLAPHSYLFHGNKQTIPRPKLYLYSAAPGDAGPVAGVQAGVGDVTGGQ